ncbi:TPA: ead/Ea22-like family protein [Klebsiella pneumoniae]|nr:ead/Ea22-like family protein [Klebsiella pneumoniae]
MTDITELAQRNELLIANGQQTADLLRHLADNEIDSDYFAVVSECESYGKETDAELSITEFALRAAGYVDALVEALENANRYIERLREWNAGLAQESCERQQLISELEPIRAAAEKLVRCKGRYHSEQNYRALAALFGVKTPDLPPLEHENVHYADAAEMEIAALRQRIAELESRTVTVKLPQRLQPGADGWDDWYMHSDNEGEYLKFDDVLAMLTAAGIKVEDE